MTTVYCGFTDCIHNKDEECNKDEIYLDEQVEDIIIGCPDAEWESDLPLKLRCEEGK